MALKHALIIFAKRPIPGRVKTRLVPALTAEGAADLYRCMLHDIVRRTAACTGLERFLFYEEESEAAAYFAGIASGMTCLQQKGVDLGERMAEAFRHVFSEGFHSVAIIGTDSPDLPLYFIENCYEHLRKNRAGAVIGPSEDGGYYLLAMNRLHAGLFREVPWSSGEVFSKSMENARTEGIRIDLLPQWYDLDTAEDLVRPGLLDLSNAAPLTRQFIAGWLKERVAENHFSTSTS